MRSACLRVLVTCWAMTNMLANRRSHPNSIFAACVGPIGYLGVVTDEDLIAEAGRRLAEAAPDAKVILFGSRARGQSRSDSDLDLIVVEPVIESRKAEFVRLRNALGEVGVPIDLIVYRASEVEKWGNVPGTFLDGVLREGRVLAGG